MVGAALLAGRAALRLGRAASIWGWSSPTPPPSTRCPELMPRKPRRRPQSGTHRPGLRPRAGNNLIANNLLEKGALTVDLPLILDDPLNLVAFEPALKAVAEQSSSTVLLPIP